MRQIKAFRAGNHDELATVMNEWLQEHNAIAIAISISVDRNPPWFHAFLIYEFA